MPMTSRLASSSGMVWAWMGVGVTYFSSVSARRIGSASPKSLKEFNSKSFYMRPDRIAWVRADTERGVRDLPRGQGCQCEKCRKTGLKTSGANSAPRSSFTRPGNDLENQVFVPTDRYMADRR